MTDDPYGPRFTRDNARGAGGSPLAWVLPLALTGLVVVLGWRLYQLSPRDGRDPSAQTRPVTPRGDLAADEKTTIDLFRAASPAVVQVSTFFSGADRTGMSELRTPVGTGSGFVWDPAGYVVTNAHVVVRDKYGGRDGFTYTVTFANHDAFDAVCVGADVFHDIAVLKFATEGKKIPALRIGTSSDLLVGQKALAMGNPFGLDQTLTHGIISGLDREINSVLGNLIHGAIQTDAAINPGNSGGPLLDSTGRVIGMNTSIASPSGGSAGVGFAIPVDTINKVVPQLMRTGHAQHAAIGIRNLTDVFSRDGRRGVVFAEFTPVSAAKDAGLRTSEITGEGAVRRAGDVIVGVDGFAVGTHEQLLQIIASHEIGQEVEIAYLRDGKERKSKVRLVGVAE